MACCEHRCRKCGAQFMDNHIYKICPVCKASDITNWMDEEISLEEEPRCYEEDDL